MKDFLTIIAKAGAAVVTMEHDRANSHMSPGKAEVTITLEIPETRYVNDLMKMLNGGYDFRRK